MDTKEISELLLRVYDYLTNEDWCGIENPVFTDEDFNLLRKFISVVCENV